LPATSKAQARFMNMIAHSPEMARQAGVPQSVGKEFSTSGSRYKSLPERKGDNVAKKKFLKKDKGEKKLKAKLSEPKAKSEDERMASRYGS
jgi:hypothetical protein